MKFFYDSEFIEGFLPNRIFGIPLPNWMSKRRHAIDLISISIVAEDGDTYTAISSEYNYDDASFWVIGNVIEPLYTYTVHGDNRNFHSDYNFNKSYGKPNKVIAKEIKEFIYKKLQVNPETVTDWHLIKHMFPIKLYGYFSAYDHVLLSSIFGTMMELPDGFPMYTIDLKQILDEKAERIFWLMTGDDAEMKNKKFEEKIEFIENSRDYPKQVNSHLSIYDAKWNKKLFEFLQKY